MKILAKSAETSHNLGGSVSGIFNRNMAMFWKISWRLAGKPVVTAILAVTVLVSCDGYGHDVRMALRSAGDNRSEIEKVIEHYSRDDKDSPKLEAALYLIGNMRYHRSFPEDLYRRYCLEADSLFLLRKSKEDTKAGLEAISEKYEPAMVPVPDLRIADADYLIWNIDYSFSQWETSPFLRHLDFSQFCEYVLPYKCMDLQPMSRWKEEYSGICRGEMDVYRQFPELEHNVRKAVETSLEALKDSIVVFYEYADCIPLLDFIPLMHLNIGTCVERSVLGLLNSRSKSLPVSLDMTPSWPNRAGVHHWNCILTDRRRNIDFEPFNNYPGYLHYTDAPCAKVYRYKFSPNPVFLDVMKKEGRLHGALDNIFLHDVTTEYCKTVDIPLRLGKAAAGAEYAYLCVFDNYRWVPVAVAGIRNRKATFRDMGLGVVYLPVVYRNGVQAPAGSPFLMDTRRQKTDIEADPENMTDMRLRRKYPAFDHVFRVRRLLRQGRIEAADNPRFRNARTMAEFPDRQYLAGEAAVSDTSSFRYWRIVSSSDASADFAELYFYDRKTGERVSGKLISSGAPVRDPYYDTPEHICDGDPLTFLSINQTDRWAGFDFGKPVSIGEVDYIRRGDGNDICPGENYSLFCWTGGGWQLIGSQTAQRVFLDFHDVPSGGLYLLCCTTSGKQQRIFLYEDGRQIWY